MTNCAVAVLGFVLGWLWRDHTAIRDVRANYAREHAEWKERNAQWQKAYNAFLTKHKELSNDNAIR